VQLPTDDFDPTGFRQVLDAGLKRFASGFTRTVALAVPRVDEQMARFNLGGPTFSQLERAITRDYSIRLEDLADGAVAVDADILVVVAPHRLDASSVFAIDQFLMRGGTVVLATSPFTAELSDGELRLQDWDSGLQDWLRHQGIDIRHALVLDQQSAAFPTPVRRSAGEYSFRDVQMVDYPYFIDLRRPGLSATNPVTANLPQLTMAWSSPMDVTPHSGQQLATLLTSSPQSWLSESMNIMPGEATAADGTERRSYKLGVALQGRFDSFFAQGPHPLADSGPTGGGNLLMRSPESARIVLFSSNDFLDDQVLGGQVMASGTQYLGPVELLLNTLDWALQDDELTQIRSRAHFNRTLPPMERQGQAIIEYLNYGAALLWLLLLLLVHWLRALLRKRRYAAGLAGQ
jgi:ABC-2 type transport system permease protein